MLYCGECGYLGAANRFYERGYWWCYCDQCGAFVQRVKQQPAGEVETAFNNAVIKLKVS